MSFHIEKYKSHPEVAAARAGEKYTAEAGIIMAQMCICDNLDFEKVEEKPNGFTVPAVWAGIWFDPESGIEAQNSIFYGYFIVPSEYADMIIHAATEGEDHWNNVQVNECIKSIRAIEKEKEAQNKAAEKIAASTAESAYFSSLKAGDEVTCTPIWCNSGFVQYATLTRQDGEGVWYAVPYGGTDADEQEITVVYPY